MNLKYLSHKTLFILSLAIMSSCTYYTHKNLISLPPTNYEHNTELLKIDGYFYYEDISSTGCYVQDSISQKLIKKDFNKVKNINVIVLYSDGGAYHSYGTFISMVDFKNCNLVDSLNTYQHVKSKFEYDVANKEWYQKEVESWGDRGVFTINNNAIKIQIYQGGGPLSSYSSIVEYSGKIVNDTLINIKQEREMRSNSITIVDKEFKFQKFEHKPNGNNPVLRNRNKFN